MQRKAIPDAVLLAHTAVLGKTASGKTSTAKRAVEQLDGFRVCVLDPIKSDWWGITSSADGCRSGLPFTILGGPHGHLPLTTFVLAAVSKPSLRTGAIGDAEHEFNKNLDAHGRYWVVAHIGWAEAKSRRGCNILFYAVGESPVADNRREFVRASHK
jgi:hypothetical protein